MQEHIAGNSGTGYCYWRYRVNPVADESLLNSYPFKANWFTDIDPLFRIGKQAC